MSPQKPGEIHDKNGVPIYPGDLVRSYHFRDYGYHGKYNYLYHVAVWNEDGYAYLIPVCHLQPEKVKGGGKYLLTQTSVDHSEVIYGYGPGDLEMYYERERVK